MYDVAVVGAGPAGSRTARGFAERGFDVVVLERGEVGRPLACSGHVSGDLWWFLSDDAEDLLLQNEVRGARFHAGGGSYRFYKDETVSYVIDRVEMDRVLADEAVAAGAELRTEVEVEDVVEEDDRVVLKTSEGEVEASVAAGCDGPRSTVRESVGLQPPGEMLQGVLAFTDEDDVSDFVDVYLDADGFFGWRIPRGDSVEYGVASRRGARDEFDRLFDVEPDSLCAGWIPIGPPGETTSERVFLVGDAAGQTKPYTGGGIIYGMRAADVACEAVDPDRPATLEEYERGWRSELSRDIRLGKQVLKMWRAPTRVQQMGLRLFEGEIEVHMDRPSTLFNRRTMRRVISNVVGR